MKQIKTQGKENMENLVITKHLQKTKGGNK